MNENEKCANYVRDLCGERLMPPLARLSFLWPFKKLLIFGVKFILFCGCQLSTHTLVENCYVSVGQQCKKPKMRENEGETERECGLLHEGAQIATGAHKLL